MCNECNKKFVDETALSQHLSSAVHAPLSDIKCVGDRKCKKRFKCPSGLLHHLESGSCRSKMNWQKMNAIVYKNDADHIITQSTTATEAKIVAIDYFSAASSTGSIIYTPSASIGDYPHSIGTVTTHSGQLTPSPSQSEYEPELQLTVSARMQCPLCSNHRIFRSLQALHNHLTSPVHAPKIFHCPSTLAPPTAEADMSKTKYFSTLSGLTQHLESGACHGGKTIFRQAILHVEEKLRQMGIGDLHLLN